MSVQPSDIHWSSYLQFEGPFYPGTLNYQASSTPDFLEKVLEVICATEGGRYDAMNMYDTCVVTIGISQLCLSAHILENMFAKCAAADPVDLAARFSALPNPVTFKPNPKGQWRFFSADGSTELATRQQMTSTFLGGASGLRGQWTQTQKDQAKATAAGFASIWENPAFCQAQLDYSKNALPWYVMSRARQSIDIAHPEDSGFKGALQALVMSYSSNVPVLADKCLVQAMSDSRWATASDEDKFELAAVQMVFHSGIAIWPIRYRAIAPVISKLWGVTLPSIDEMSVGQIPPAAPTDDGLGTIKGIQAFLIAQGYDLGPAADDGVFGPKSKTALLSFQAAHGLPSTGVCDDNTHAEMLRIKNQ